MERFRRRRTRARVSSSVKVTTIVDQSSKNWVLSTHSQGNELVEENDKFPKTGSHSRTKISLESLEENQLSFDFGRGNGTPMKKLLADEMAKETESTRRSPNVIARLMGFDGISTSHNTTKKQKQVSYISKNNKSHDNRSRRKFSIGQQPFKDVYEVKERSNMETRSNISSKTSNRSYNKDEIRFIRKKFTDAKRFSTDENSRHSKEFHDTIEVLNSNKDLLLRFLEEPNLLFSKHLHDLHGVRELYYGDTSRKIDINHSHKHWTNSCSNFYDRNSTNSVTLNTSFERNKNASQNHTKIMVLKPNLDKTFELTPQNPVLGVRSKGSKDNTFESYGRKSQESRELAREITRRMKNKLERDSLNLSSIESLGYSADESSHDSSENDSSYESELTFVSSQTASDKTLNKKLFSSRHTESSVNIEAKKRLSERWKMNHRSQEFGDSSKATTLAEMLAIPDEGRFGNIKRNDGITELFNPLGISSRDGLKGGYIQTLSRSRSLPNYDNYFGSPKSISKREAITTENFVIRKENVGHVRSKAIKRDSRRQDGSFLENMMPNDEKYQSFCSVNVDSDIKNVVDGNDSPEVKTVILETPACHHNRCLDINEEVLGQESSSFASPQKGPSSNDVPSLRKVGGSSYLQCTPTHLKPPESSKDSEQPSPNSVLEVPFVEDISSGSECFERVSAELNGLRMQLKLLKQESEFHIETTMLSSNDEFSDESTEFYDNNYFPHLQESWVSRYIIDMWALSGLEKINPEFFLSAWHSPNCPISPYVFEDLEKRYSELKSRSKSERKLVCDNINSRIMELTEQFISTEPWVKKQVKNKNPEWVKDVLKTELQKLVENNEKKTSENELDMVILSKMGWMMLEEHISVIGKDIEALLIDELVSETFHALYYNLSLV